MPREIVKEVPFLKIYSDGTFRLDDIRVSYPHFDKPWAKNPEKEQPKYNGVGLLNKVKHKAAKRLLDELISEKVKELKLKAMPEKDKCLRNGDAEGAKEEYVGCWTINFSSPADRPPSVRGKDTRPLAQNKIKSTILAGYQISLMGKLWAQDNEWGKKVNCDLIGVQFRREDETFGEGQISEDDIDDTFDATDEEDEGSGFDDDDDL